MARFFLNPSALSFYNNLKGKYPTSNMEGDGQQTGGVFVVSPEGKLLYSFKENDHEPSMFGNATTVESGLPCQDPVLSWLSAN